MQKFLRDYNEERSAEDWEADIFDIWPVFVTEHLPKTYVAQKKCYSQLLNKQEKKKKRIGEWMTNSTAYSLRAKKESRLKIILPAALMTRHEYEIYFTAIHFF